MIMKMSSWYCLLLLSGAAVPLVAQERPVERALERAPRHRERPGIARECARGAAEHVARELVEDDDQRERGERRRPPSIELALLRLLPQRKKAPADLGAEGRRLPEPRLAHESALRRIRGAEPEIEDLGEVG